MRVKRLVGPTNSAMSRRSTRHSRCPRPGPPKVGPASISAVAVLEGPHCPRPGGRFDLICAFKKSRQTTPKKWTPKSGQLSGNSTPISRPLFPLYRGGRGHDPVYTIHPFRVSGGSQRWPLRVGKWCFTNNSLSKVAINTDIIVLVKSRQQSITQSDQLHATISNSILLFIPTTTITTCSVCRTTAD